MGNDDNDDEITGSRILTLLSSQVAALISPTAAQTANPRPDAAELMRLLRENRGPVRVHGPYDVADTVELHSVEFEHGLEINGVAFKRRVDLRDVTFRRTVDLRGCTFEGGLVLEGATVQGSLLLDDVTLGKDAGDAQGRAACLHLLRVSGDLLARGLHAGGGVDLTRADVRGRLEIATATTLRRAWIAGPLHLSSAEVGGDVRLNAIMLEGDLDADRLRAGSHVRLTPLREHYETDEGAVRLTSVIKGDVNLGLAHIEGQLDLSCAHVRGLTILQSAEVRGGVFARCKHARCPVFGDAVHLVGARIESTVDFSGARLKADLLLTGADITGAVFVSDGWRAREGPPPGAADRAHGPDLRARVDGSVDLSHATVSGAVQVLGARIGQALRFDTATVTGFVNIAGSIIGGELDLRSATVHGQLVCTCDEGERSRVGGKVRCRSARIESGARFLGVDLEGDVDMAGSTVSGRLEFRAGCTVEGAHGATVSDGEPTRIGGALDLSDATVAGSLDGRGLEVRGPVRLARADVRGWVELRDAKIHGPPLPASAPVTAPAARASAALSADTASGLYAAGVQIGAQLRLNGAQVWGDVNLSHARIGEGVCAGTQVADGTKEDAAAAWVSGAFFLDSAHVGGSADFRGATIGGSLSLERGYVEGKLRCRRVKADAPAPAPAAVTSVGELNLRDATIHHLDLSSGGENAKPKETLLDGQVKLDGCVFHELTVPSDDYAGLFPGGSTAFRQEGYLAMERWLRERGEDGAGEKVYDRMREHRRKTLSHVAALGDRIVGGARKVSLAFPVLILVSVIGFVLTVAVFSTPRSVVGDAKEAPVAAAGARAAAPAAGGSAHPREWGLGDALLFAAHTHLPMFSLPRDERWNAAPEPIGPVVTLRFDAYALLVSLLSYVMVPLVLGGIATSWLQRRGKP